MKKAVIYSVVLCAVSWIAALVFCNATGFDGTQVDMAMRSSYAIFATAYMFLPMIVALAMQLVCKGDKPFDNTLGLLRFRPRWSWLVGALLVPVAVLLCAGVASLFVEPVSMAESIRMQVVATLGDTPAAEGGSGYGWRSHAHHRDFRSLPGSSGSHSCRWGGPM